jgi:hypothetical protein
VPNNDYRFIDKDPVIDVIRTEAQRYGNLSHRQLSQIAMDSGVSVSTLQNWFNGDTRRPQSLSTRFVLQALNVHIEYVRDDGTSIRQPKPTMIPKSEQDKILKKERERERERKREKANGA